jgi:hypothetical protein
VSEGETVEAWVVEVVALGSGSGCGSGSVEEAYRDGFRWIGSLAKEEKNN